MHNEIKKKDKSTSNKLGSYISGLIFNTLFLFLANRLPEWNFNFITDQYTSVLFALYLSFGLQASGNLMLILYRPLPLHHITQVVFNGISFYASYMLFTVFPLDFSSVDSFFGKPISLSPLNMVFKVLFGVSMAVSLISGLVNLIKFIRTIVSAPGDGER